MFLFRIIILQVAITFYDTNAFDYTNQKLISSAFEVMGYSPVCVASALTTCELSTKNAVSIDVADLLFVMKKLISALEQTDGNSTFPCCIGNNVNNLFEELNSTLLGRSRSLFHSLATIESDVKQLSLIGNRINTTLMESVQSNVQDLEKKNKDFSVGSSQNVLLSVFTGKDCAELRARGDVSSGVRTIFPFGIFNGRVMQPVMTYCDQTTDGGGWTVFQNREALPLRENFYRTWNDYVTGFGNLQGEFWLGLDNIHALVNSSQMEMRVDLEDYEGTKVWAKYGSFYVGNDSTKYVMKIGKYSGNAGDSLIEWHNGMKFSTHDQDNDLDTGTSCSTLYRGAWWYKNCHASNLNGYQYVGKQTSYADGVIWSSFKGHYYSLKKSSMKFRSV